MKARIRLVILFAVFLGLSLAGYRHFRDQRVNDKSIRLSGVVEGNEVNLAPKMAGKISDVRYREGDAIEKGEIAFSLEGDDVRALADQAAAGVELAGSGLAVARSSLEAARAAADNAGAGIVSAGAEVEKARVMKDEALLEKGRAEALYRAGYTARASADQAVAAYEVAVASYRASEARLQAALTGKSSADAQVRAAEGQIRAAEARLREAEANMAVMRSRLSDLSVVSPISGTVVFKAIEKGETVTAGTTTLTVVDLSDLRVRVDMEETKVGRIRINGEALIRTGAYVGVVKGRISEIGRYAEFATQRDVTRGRQDIRTFRVTIKVDDPEGILKPGMTVEVEMPVNG